MKRLVTIALALLFAAAPLSGQNTAGQKKQLEKLRNEIAELDRQIKANDSKSADATSRLELARKKVETGKKLVEEAGSTLDSLNLALEAKEKEIESADAMLDVTIGNYSKLVRKYYLVRDTKLWLVFILSGEDFAQTLRRAAYMKSISSTLSSQARDIRGRQTMLEQQKTELDSLKSDYELILKQRSEDLNALKADETAEKNLVDKLKKDQNKYRKQLAVKQKEAEALNKKIQEMVRKQQPSSTSKKSKSNFASRKGKLPWPVSGTVVGHYGQHYHPVYRNVALPFNNGINIATKTGAEVRLVHDGEVRQVVVMPGYNQCVLVQHGEYYSFYCKLKDVLVKSGDKLKAGTLLGHVDTIAGETQLHFQIWKGTDSLDPEKWLRN